jgi:hypothetical protein
LAAVINEKADEIALKKEEMNVELDNKLAQMQENSPV